MIIHVKKRPTIKKIRADVRRRAGAAARQSLQTDVVANALGPAFAAVI
ncbi:MAG: hypothetical protein PHQ53_04475 [Candidatus Krumholzibacteria bacterium]|nr:hypothetical protein [Candidatus Krumholzibacteria bacterium]